MRTETIKRLEDRIAREDDLSKIAMPMDWGIDALVPPAVCTTLSPREQLMRYAARHRTRSDVFYRPDPTNEYVFSEGRLTFPSAIRTETPENNVVPCRVFETRRRSKAVILLPHWNARKGRYKALGVLLRSLGVTTLEVPLPYSEERRPAQMTGADSLLSANLGRTIRSVRQAVLDCRLATDWLEGRGYSRIGLLGCSLGSAIGVVLMAHEPRLRAGALLLMGSDFAETVWMSHATRHIEQAVCQVLTLAELKQIWSVISPTSYAAKLQHSSPLLVISGRHDRVCPPHLTQQGIEAMARAGLDYTWKVWPCGHYTLGAFPYKFYLATTLASFFRRAL
jgi:pimeloyl-ACP methyl ester carboxylesterase